MTNIETPLPRLPGVIDRFCCSFSKNVIHQPRSGRDIVSYIRVYACVQWQNPMIQGTTAAWPCRECVTTRSRVCVVNIVVINALFALRFSGGGGGIAPISNAIIKRRLNVIKKKNRTEKIIIIRREGGEGEKYRRNYIFSLVFFQRTTKTYGCI